MMELIESNPTVAMVEELMKRHQMTPMATEQVRGIDTVQWFFTPRVLTRCIDCAKLSVTETQAGTTLRVRLDKGLGQQSRTYNVPTQFVMYEPWMYTSVTEDAIRIQNIMDTARQIPLHVWLQVTNGLVPGFHPITSPFHHNFHWILNEQGQMSLKEPVFDVSEVGRIQEVTNLQELLMRLPQLREWQWYWTVLSWGIVEQDIVEQNASILLQSLQDLWH